jgi:hypothetical protein
MNFGEDMPAHDPSSWGEDPFMVEVTWGDWLDAHPTLVVLKNILLWGGTVLGFLVIAVPYILALLLRVKGGDAVVPVMVPVIQKLGAVLKMPGSSKFALFTGVAMTAVPAVMKTAGAAKTVATKKVVPRWQRLSAWWKDRRRKKKLANSRKKRAKARTKRRTPGKTKRSKSAP